jgi:hypothetical protein
MLTGKPHRCATVVALAVLALLWCGAAVDPAIAEQDSAAPASAEALLPSPAGPAIRVHSVTSDDHLEGTVDGIVAHDFEAVRALLAKPETWCDILPLHLNVKACVYVVRPEDPLTVGTAAESVREDGETLSLYLGRKFYQEPGSAYRLNFHFRVLRADDQGLAIALRAAQGPFGTHDYALTFTATPNGEGRTRIHLGYAYRFGLISRLAMAGYLHTAGRNKIGFSVEGHDAAGRPVYVGGLRGVIERNAVRYHLAIQAYLDTRDRREPTSFKQLLRRWYDLTNNYPDQLYEVDAASYLEDKERERLNQLRLQRELAPAGAAYGPSDRDTPVRAGFAPLAAHGGGEG